MHLLIGFIHIIKHKVLKMWFFVTNKYFTVMKLWLKVWKTHKNMYFMLHVWELWQKTFSKKTFLILKKSIFPLLFIHFLWGFEFYSEVIAQDNLNNIFTRSVRGRHLGRGGGYTPLHLPSARLWVQNICFGIKHSFYVWIHYQDSLESDLIKVTFLMVCLSKGLFTLLKICLLSQLL